MDAAFRNFNKSRSRYSRIFIDYKNTALPVRVLQQDILQATLSLDSSHRSVTPISYPRMASVSGRRLVSVEDRLLPEHVASLGAVGRESIKVACRVRPAARDESRVWFVSDKVRNASPNFTV